MAKFYCEHEDERGTQCPFACLEYTEKSVVVVSRHKTGRLQQIRHVNKINITEILRMAVEDGDGIHLIEEILALLGKNNLTEIL